ncbi:NAD-dependent succinate-semialdehyde dehydrogenase [Rosenbergiella nectarea]|uniref:NAD-dependent succinate-semialdehyde dehydrogenase n=1 Tax=Rosenbergiella nectarea TaxID=988801 RepID=UPI001F4E728C|nr:NAD-dependent succinate-semialdehyde dehydrogenase [Rosenbergiella nectarea]
MILDINLYINGEWLDSYDHKTMPIINPATEEVIGRVAVCHRKNLDDALVAAQSGFDTWRVVSSFDRSQLMKKAALLLRERVDHISSIMSIEQGKPFIQAKAEILSATNIIDWFASEAVRAYGQVIPPRNISTQQLTICEPVGPVAAFTPWNFPINQIIRKLCAAISAGCSIIIKGPEETPASPAELIKVFHDAGIPPGVVNLVFGVPSEISNHLIKSPVIKKVSFTGSVSVGKEIASLAGKYMKRVTMELGGHAPVIICEDAEINVVVEQMIVAKFRNSGQVCIAPTRFLVHEKIYDLFKLKLVDAIKELKVGPSDNEGNNIGPLIHKKALTRVHSLVEDALVNGASLVLGGNRLNKRGFFYEPTVLEDLPHQAKILHEEPFGPIILLIRFKSLDDAILEANSLPYGLAAYAYSYDSRNIMKISNNVKCGMLAINHVGLALPELPFGGIGESGYGTEGGSEALACYLDKKLVSLQAC